jgi:hypothetical protein
VFDSFWREHKLPSKIGKMPKMSPYNYLKVPLLTGIETYGKYDED